MNENPTAADLDEAQGALERDIEEYMSEKGLSWREFHTSIDMRAVKLRKRNEALRIAWAKHNSEIA